MYTLRFPFSIAQNILIKGTETIKQIENLAFTLKKDDPFYILIISGFPTEAAANNYIEKLHNGLIWMLLDGGIPSKAEFEAGSIDENRYVNGNKPAIYPSNPAPQIWTGYPPTISTNETTINKMLESINEGVSFSIDEKLVNQPKLETALDLYAAYFSEYSLNAKFLTLMLILEALKPKSKPTPVVKSKIKKYRTEIQNILENVDSSSEDIESLNALDGALQYVSKKSITEAIRLLVLTTLQNNGDQYAEEMASKATELYKLRGKLVHDGKIELTRLTEATKSAKIIVERILKAKFMKLTNKTPHNTD